MSIIVKDLTHIYMEGTPFQSTALKNVSFEIKQGEFVGLIGHTGSGKSTLIQHLNGLLKPTKGQIIVNGLDLSAKSTDLKKIRQKVGLVFQYPEHQLFEENVYREVAFGPRNMGLDEKEVDRRVKKALAMVKLNQKELYDRSPFSLSGGQMRRLAIAGVLAMEPEILILDEPTAGLDPRARDEILQEIKDLHDKLNITVILVSHSMEDIARLVDKLIVMHRGQVALQGTAREVFSQPEILKKIGLDVPQVTELMHKLKERGLKVRTDVLTVEESKQEILKALRGNDHD
ncbi:MAG TPA: energy-coupling factor transporter ATPase [Clostridia bacterium]|nr:energy-coupling factor transporter ATPase [Clostridia bacterium]